MAGQQKTKGKGCRKYGRNKKPVNSAMSAFIRNKISFESYCAQNKPTVSSMLKSTTNEKDKLSISANS